MATIGEMLIDINSAKQNIKAAADTSSNDLNTYATAIYAAKDASYNAGYTAGQASGGQTIYTVGTMYSDGDTISAGDYFAISKLADGAGVCDTMQSHVRMFEVNVYQSLGEAHIGFTYTQDGDIWTVIGEDNNYYYLVSAGTNTYSTTYVDNYSSTYGVYHCTKKTYT